jgi:hypothetical protein
MLVFIYWLSVENLGQFPKVELFLELRMILVFVSCSGSLFLADVAEGIKYFI